MRKFVIALVATTPALLGLAAAAPASAQTADVQQCAPDINGGTLAGGVCVLPGMFQGQLQEDFLVNSAGSVDGWQVVSGAIPPGLTLPSTFGAGATIVAGTPTQQGTFAFTVENFPADGSAPSLQAYSITVGPALPLTVTLPAGGTSLASGTVGSAYAANFFVSGGIAPYNWTVAAGQLPPGLSLASTAGPNDTNNQLAGTPTQAGTFTFTMEVTDGAGNHATQQFSVTIAG